MLSGWLFDCYALADKLVFWIKQYNGTTVRLEDKTWSTSIYVASDDKSDLYSILNTNDEKIVSLIKDHEFISRYEKITDCRKHDILKLTLSDSTKAPILARRIEKLCTNSKLRFYNVDLPPEQSYFYEHDIFPLAFCKIGNNNYNRQDDSKLSWVLKDNVWSTDYKVPEFRSTYLKVKLRKEGKIKRYSDRISSIILSKNNKQDDNEGSSQYIEIASESEVGIIEELTEMTKKIDPDFIFTYDGDSFTFPYLIHRAEQNGTTLVLGREPTISLKRNYKEGTSYFSYGKIYFKPTTVRLFGRIHFDTNNSFILNDSGLEGLYEIARICRMPLHTAARASIGKCLSSLQCYYATQKEILVPWKPALAEHFKSFEDLLVADRGGFIFEPEIGVHEQVAEFDFVSLYPNIMLKKNLSAETILCDCCRQDSRLTVPELGYQICEKKIGIIPTSLKIVLDKREKYKELKNNAASNPKLKAIYDARQSSLKWILVTSFGYLGFNNAKFGRIDAHIAVCAFDRQILLQTVKIAERHGFRVLHGIVDSIWVKKRDDLMMVTKTNIPMVVSPEYHDNYLKLKEVLEQELGFAISFEEIYKWLVFVNSKTNYQLPVANRYFGAFEDGSLKIRGIEARRHDTPPIFYKCQNEILELMATRNNPSEVRELMPAIKDVFHKYVRLLKENQVPFEELIFTKRISKNSDEYQDRNTIENSAIMNLTYEGRSLKAGEALQYIIVDYYQKHSSEREKRAVPAELISDDKTTNAVNYDIQRYTELIADSCNSVTKPFGLTLLAPKPYGANKDTIWNDYFFSDLID